MFLKQERPEMDYYEKQKKFDCKVKTLILIQKQ